MKNEMTKDRIVGMILIVLGALVAVGAKMMKVTMRLSVGDPGPRLFLYLAAVGLMVCGAGIMLSRTPDRKMLSLSGDQWKKFILLFLVLAAYLAGLKVLGFLIATPVMTVALVWILKQNKKGNLLGTCVYAIALTAALYVVFVRILSIVLPKGMLLK